MKTGPYVKNTVKYVGRDGGPVNLPGFGGHARSGSPKLSASPMFNDSGEINATNASDALVQIKHVLDEAASGRLSMQPRSAGMELSAVEQQQILAEAFSDPSSEGFHLVGQELLNPVKEVIDYEGWIRKVLMVRPVRQGEIVRYDKDVFIVAWVVAEDAETVASVVGGQFVFPPEFEVTAQPMIELKNIYQAQYDILARAQDRARQSIEFKEDKAGINLLDRAAISANQLTYFSSFNTTSAEALRYKVERNRLVLDKFLINRQELSDIVAMSQLGQVDPVTQRELILAGYIGTLLNAMIITSAGVNTYEVVPPGIVYGVTAPEYLGGMPIRVELFSEPVTDFHEGKARRGWFWYELLSQVVINPTGCAKGIKL